MQDFYSTTDFYIAVSLMTAEFPVEDLNRDNPQRVEFLFIQSPELEEFVKNFWARKIKVEPNLFAQNIKILKNRLYATN